MKEYFKRKASITLDVPNIVTAENFTSRVRHILSLGAKKDPGDYRLAIVPLSDGVLTKIQRDSFAIEMDTDGRLILTRKDGKVQLVFDYDKGYLTAVLGGILYETYDLPRRESTDYHG